MIAVVYFIPVIACLLLHFQFGYQGEWWHYLCVFLGGEAVVGISHYLFYHKHVSCYEFLGSIITSIHFEDEWTERHVYYETRTDSKGRTYTVRKVSHIYHPEKYYFDTSTGKRYTIDESFFDRIKDLWQLPRNKDVWRGGDIVGGVRYGCHYSFDDFSDQGKENPVNWVPVSYTHSYKNKIQKSNSIFKFETISDAQARDLGLYDYPDINDAIDIPAVLSGILPVDPNADTLFRKFNGRFGPDLQMRLFILLFPAEKGAGISEIQRAYWEGANKNEFVICLGVDAAGKVEWSRTFSWADEQNLELETDSWFMRNKTIDWKNFFDWFIERSATWKRKEFKDFDYIYVSLPQKYFILTFLISLLENALVIYFLTYASFV